MHEKDLRMRSLEEMMRGVKTIKYNSYEKFFDQRVIILVVWNNYSLRELSYREEKKTQKIKLYFMVFLDWTEEESRSQTAVQTEFYLNSEFLFESTL